MPLYEYECLACRRRTEKIQKFSDAEITICPTCGGELKRVISAPAFTMKGGGWYADGYGNAKPPAAGAESTTSEKPAAPASDTSGSAAPAAPATPAAALSAPPPAAAATK